MTEPSHRELEEAVRQASKRYAERRRALTEIERRAEEDAGYALSTARELAVRARYRRRRGRRNARSTYSSE